MAAPWLTDSSPSNHTGGSDSTYSLTYKKFGMSGGHCQVLGNIGWQTALTTDFSFGTDDFTIEVWVERVIDQATGTARTGIASSFSGYTRLGWGIWFEISSLAGGTLNKVGFYINEGRVILSSSPLPATMTHVAVVRNGNTVTMYFDGVSVGSYNATGISINGQIYASLGIWGGDYSSYYSDIYVDEFRILKGTAAWIEDFTPPEEAYTDATMGEDCVLLAHLDAGIITGVHDDVVVSEYLPFANLLALSVEVYDTVTITEQQRFPLNALESVFQAWTGYTDEGTTNVNGSPILYKEEGRKENGGQPLNLKTGAEVEVVVRGTSGHWFVFVYVSFDDSGYEPVGSMDTYSADEGSDVCERFHVDRFESWREARVKVEQLTTTSTEEIVVLETNVFATVEEYMEED